MGTPTIPDLAEAAAEALSATVDSGTGIKHQDFNADDNSSPTAFAQLMNLERKIMMLLTGPNGGQVIWSGSGLTVGANPLEYELAATAYSFAGNDAYSLSLPVSETSYVYLDSDETLESQLGGWPGGNHFKLAVVTTNGTQVTSITDMRMANFQIGVDSAWWTFLPTAAVDMKDQDLDKIATLGLSDPTTVVLDVDGEIVLASQPSLLYVDTYASASSDDLESIGTMSASDKGRLWLLRAANSGRTVTIKAAALGSAHGDFVMDDTTKWMIVISRGGGITELTRSYYTFPTLAADLDANGKNITDVGVLSLKAVNIQIASGSLAITTSKHRVDTEAYAAEDDLDTITGGTKEGQLLRLQARAAGEVTTVKHATGNIKLHNSKDYRLDGVDRRIDLEYDGSTYWNETTRSHPSIADLAGTAEGIPYDFSMHISGVPAVAVDKWKRRVPAGFTLKRVHGYVGTAPGAGGCIVDVLIDGLSMFASQSEMVNIADGTTYDVSDTKNKAVAAGESIEVEVEAANSAADLTLTFEGYIAPQTPPT